MTTSRTVLAPIAAAVVSLVVAGGARGQDQLASVAALRPWIEATWQQVGALGEGPVAFFPLLSKGDTAEAVPTEASNYLWREHLQPALPAALRGKLMYGDDLLAAMRDAEWSGGDFRAPDDTLLIARTSGFALAVTGSVEPVRGGIRLELLVRDPATAKVLVERSCLAPNSRVRTSPERALCDAVGARLGSELTTFGPRAPRSELTDAQRARVFERVVGRLLDEVLASAGVGRDARDRAAAEAAAGKGNADEPGVVGLAPVLRGGRVESGLEVAPELSKVIDLGLQARLAQRGIDFLAPHAFHERLVGGGFYESVLDMHGAGPEQGTLQRLRAGQPAVVGVLRGSFDRAGPDGVPFVELRFSRAGMSDVTKLVAVEDPRLQSWLGQAMERPCEDRLYRFELDPMARLHRALAGVAAEALRRVGNEIGGRRVFVYPVSLPGTRAYEIAQQEIRDLLSAARQQAIKIGQSQGLNAEQSLAQVKLERFDGLTHDELYHRRVVQPMLDQADDGQTRLAHELAGFVRDRLQAPGAGIAPLKLTIAAAGEVAELSSSSGCVVLATSLRWSGDSQLDVAAVVLDGSLVAIGGAEPEHLPPRYAKPLREVLAGAGPPTSGVGPGGGK